MDLRGVPRNKQGGGVYPLETDRGTSKRADVVLGYLTMYGPGPRVHPAGWFSSVCRSYRPRAARSRPVRDGLGLLPAVLMIRRRGDERWRRQGALSACFLCTSLACGQPC